MNKQGKKPKGLQFKLLFKFRKERKKRSFQKEFPVDLTSSSSTILNRFFMKVKLLYFFTYIFSCILTVKHLSLNFVCFLILLEKCQIKRPTCYRKMIYMLLNFIERFHIYNVFQNKLSHRLIFYLILSLRSLRLTVNFFYNAIETKEILRYVYIYACCIRKKKCLSQTDITFFSEIIKYSRKVENRQRDPLPASSRGSAT